MGNGCARERFDARGRSGTQCCGGVFIKCLIYGPFLECQTTGKYVVTLYQEENNTRTHTLVHYSTTDIDNIFLSGQ